MFWRDYYREASTPAQPGSRTLDATTPLASRAEEELRRSLAALKAGTAWLRR